MNAGSLRGLSKVERELADACKWLRTSVDLRGIDLREFPAGLLASLHFRQSLCRLELSHNSLAHLPPEIGQLRCLRQLYVGHNRLSDLPASLALLGSLELLDASHNCLSAVPISVASLRSLRYLNLSGNSISCVDSDVLRLPALAKLYITRNPIENVPRHVYVAGLEKLREYFGVVVAVANGSVRAVCDGRRKRQASRVSPTAHLRECVTALRISQRPNSGSRFSAAGTGVRSPAAASSAVACPAGLQHLPAAAVGGPTSDYGTCSGGDRCSDATPSEAAAYPAVAAAALGGAPSLCSRRRSSARRRRRQQQRCCRSCDRSSQAVLTESVGGGSLCCCGSGGSGSCCAAAGDGGDDCRCGGSNSGGSAVSGDHSCSPESGSTLTGGAGGTSYDFTAQWCDRHAADAGRTSPSSAASSFSLGSSIDDLCAAQSSGGGTRPAEDAYFRLLAKTLADHTRVLKYKNVVAVIPAHNRNGYVPDEFTLDVIEDLYYTPQLTERSLHASQVVRLGPHGSSFYDDEPALVYLPLGADVSAAVGSGLAAAAAARVVCLCSDTSAASVPDWRPLPTSDYDYLPGENKVVIRARHFSLFTAIISSPYPSATEHVSPRRGSRIVVPEVPGVEVLFPSGAVETDVDVSIKVYYDDEPPASQPQQAALATPVVLLSPHACPFRRDVRIRLPLPDCQLVCERFGLDPRRSLSVWCSPTGDGEPARWQRCDVAYEIEECSSSSDGESGKFAISFAVRHFSWYKALWDMVATAVHGAKIGVSYVYPRIRFLMMCQAMMEESGSTRSFGLEVICYRSDKKLPETGNYKHRVGGSLKPKFVRPGTIVIRLVSQDFEADTLHGEDPSLTKEEVDFHGMEFEKQFACVYKGEIIQKGVMGKCVVERIAQDHKENIFEFNLTKNSLEGELIMDAADAWSLTATRELASMLNVTSDDNWKVFARQLGFTSHEIRNKLCNTTDPFAMMMGAFQARGGTPQEFMQALYHVGRDFRVGGVGETRGSSPESSDGGSGKRVLNRSHGSGGFRPTTDEEDSFSEDCSSPGPSRSSTPNRKRPLMGAPGAGEADGGHRKTKRRRSDMSDSLSSDYSSVHEESANRTCKQEMETSELWKISQFINQNWKSLGRTLSVPEEDLNCIEHAAHKDMRECAYQMLLKWKERFPTRCKYGVLYVALTDSGLNSVARAHCVYHQRSRGSPGVGGLFGAGTRTV